VDLETETLQVLIREIIQGWEVVVVEALLLSPLPIQLRKLLQM
jgi:hypothetical protein